MKVFIGGSRHVTRLPVEVISRIENIIRQAGMILIGDANGADKAVQAYLSSIEYSNVTVFYVGQNFRNNIGGWETRRVECESKTKDFYYYACKDRAMADEANFGFMIWDGKSKGTINNALNLLRGEKRLLVFNANLRAFRTLSTMSDLRSLLSETSNLVREKLIQDLKINEFYDELPQKSLTYAEAMSHLEQPASHHQPRTGKGLN